MNRIESHAYFALNDKGEESQLLQYMKIFFKINTSGIKFEGYFHFIHHSGSDEIILPIHLLSTTDFRKSNREEKLR